VKTKLENEKMKNHNSTRRLALGIDQVTPEVACGSSVGYACSLGFAILELLHLPCGNKRHTENGAIAFENIQHTYDEFQHRGAKTRLRRTGYPENTSPRPWISARKI
jgi:hypothetical protein